MTLNELKNEVLSLTFETELDSHSAFVFAANRALMEIHSEKDRTECAEIYKKKLSANEHFKKLSHENGSEQTLRLSGRTFSLTAVGTGKLLFADGTDTEEIDFTGTGVEIKRIIKTGEAFLTLKGDFSYDLYNIASFDSLSSQNPCDIPIYRDFELFDMKKINPLFLAFSAPPKDSLGSLIPGARAEGSTLSVPKDFEGKILVSYKRMPRKILDSEIDTELDISPECSHLLALRCASYLLLDENEGLANYYLSLYKNGMSAVKIYNRKGASAGYTDVLGWA